MTSYMNSYFPYVAILLIWLFTHINQTKATKNFNYSDNYHGMSEEEIYISKIFGEDKIYTIDGIRPLNASFNQLHNKNIRHLSLVSPKPYLSSSRQKFLNNEETLRKTIQDFLRNGTLGKLENDSFLLNNTNPTYPMAIRRLLPLSAVNPNFTMKFYIPEIENKQNEFVDNAKHDVINRDYIGKKASNNELLTVIDCDLLNAYFNQVSPKPLNNLNEQNNKEASKFDSHNFSHLRLRHTGPKLRALLPQSNETTDTANFAAAEPARQNRIINNLSRHVKHQVLNSTSRFHRLFFLDNLTRPNIFNSTGIRLLPSYSANITVTENRIELPHPNISRHLSKLTEFGEERLENGKKIMSKYLHKLNMTKQHFKEKTSSIKDKEGRLITENRKPFRSLNRPPFLNEPAYPKVQKAVFPPLSVYLGLLNSSRKEGYSTNKNNVFMGISNADDSSPDVLDPKLSFYAMEIQNAIKSIQQTNELATQCRFIGLLQYLLLTGRIYRPEENPNGESPQNCLNSCTFNHLSDLLDSSVSLKKSSQILQKNIRTSSQPSMDPTSQTFDQQVNLAASSIEEAEKSRLSLNQILAELEAFQIILTKGESSTYFNLVNKLKTLYSNPPLELKEEEFTTAIEGIQKFIERLQLYWTLYGNNLEQVKNIRIRCNEIISMIDSNALQNNYQAFDTKISQLITILENIHLELYPTILNNPSDSDSESQETGTKFVLTFAPNDVFEGLAEVSTTNPLKNTKDTQDKKVEQLISKFQMESTGSIHEIGLNLLKRLRQNSFIGFEQISNLREKLAKVIGDIPDRFNHTKSLVLLPAILHHALREQGREAGRIHMLVNRFKTSRLRLTEIEPNLDGNALTVRDVLANLKSAIFQTPRKFYNTERRERYLKRFLDNKFSNAKNCLLKPQQNDSQNEKNSESTEPLHEEAPETYDSNEPREEARSLQKLAPQTLKLPGKIHVIPLKKLNSENLFQNSKQITTRLNTPPLQQVNVNCSGSNKY